MKNLKLKRIEGSNIINFLNEKHDEFYIISKYDSYGNDAQIDFDKIASPCNSLEEFKQALENLQIEEMVHSTYFSDYLHQEHYGELVKNLDGETIVHLINVENLTYSLFLNNENGEELESYHDLHRSHIEFLEQRIKNSINEQLDIVNRVIDWVENYNNFVEDYQSANIFEIAEYIANNNYFDYLHGLTITNVDDLYLKEEEQEEFDNLTNLVNKAREVLELKKALTSKQENSNSNNRKIKI